MKTVIFAIKKVQAQWVIVENVIPDGVQIFQVAKKGKDTREWKTHGQKMICFG